MCALGLVPGWFVAPEHVSFDSIAELAGAAGPSFVTTLLSVFLVMNVFLCAFNLLPLPPLDGAAVLNGFLPERHALKLMELQSNAMMSMVGPRHRLAGVPVLHRSAVARCCGSFIRSPRIRNSELHAEAQRMRASARIARTIDRRNSIR